MAKIRTERQKLNILIDIVNPHYSRVPYLQNCLLAKFYFKTQINTCSALVYRKYGLPNRHILSWGKKGQLSAFLFLQVSDQKIETVAGQCMECSGSGARWTIWIPTLAPVCMVASGRHLNTSAPHFLFCKINRIYQAELFLGYKIIMLCVCVCVIISPRSNGSVYANSLFMETIEHNYQV